MNSVRKQQIQNLIRPVLFRGMISRIYAAHGHEFASHMVTHPYLAGLDEPNMLYEMEASRKEILKQLGQKYTFSAEGPYGTENERVMKYICKIYPATRNRMPETFMEELNRSNSQKSWQLQQGICTMAAGRYNQNTATIDEIVD